MKRFLCTVGMVMLAAALATAQRLPGNAVPQHYKILLNPDLPTATYTGEETIDVNVSKPTSSITLNALEIDFKESTITAGGSTQTAKVALDPKSEMATLTVDKPIPPGPAQIHITFGAKLNDQLRGFYLSHGKDRTYAVTQMEPTDARRAFPCFDEPALKATFDISTVADKNDTAVSNGRIVSDTSGPGESKHTITFAQTPKMSSYLVALSVGDFKCLEGSSDGVPIRVCATPDKVQLGQVALESAEHILHYFNQYYGIKYPYGKLDIIASPDFSAGAMENTADIVYREILLFVDPKTASPQDRKLVADVLAHEMAHQWFGDLVTMQWWNDIWLNEGFATWMSPKPVRDWHPDWNNRMDEVESDASALVTDSLKSTRAIRTDATTTAQISELFDSIAYNKTAAVLRMIESYVTPEVFRTGVNQYLKDHAYSNATAEDFWNTITRASKKPVDKVMGSFVEQPGVPLVSVSAKCSANKTQVTLAQQRFFIDRAAMQAGSQELWQIPVCLKTDKGSKCELLTQKQQTVSLDGCASWLDANSGARGYYRSAYDAAGLRALTPVIESNLAADERYSLVNDQWYLLRAGRGTIGDFLQLVQGYKSDRDRAIWDTLFGRLEYVDDYLVNDSDRSQYQAWVRDLLTPAAKELGWTPKPDESADMHAVRANILGALAFVGNDPETIAQARTLAQQAVKDLTSVDPDLLPIVINVAAENGDAALYDQYLATIKTKQNPNDYYLFQDALTKFRQPELLKRNQDLLMSAEIRNQDATGFLGSMLRNKYTRDQAWEFVKSHWPELETKLASYTRGQIINSTSGFCDVQKRDEVSNFFTPKHIPSAERGLRQTMERINACIDLKASQEPNLQSWLQQQKPATQAKN